MDRTVLTGTATIRVFLAHRKDEQTSADMEQALQELFEREYPEQRVEVVSGSRHFQDHAHALGGWEAWIYHVHSGSDADEDGTERPAFDVCVVPDGRVGRATYAIVRGFLDADKPVICWDRGLRAARVVDVEVVAPGDWRSYAELRLAELRPAERRLH